MIFGIYIYYNRFPLEKPPSPQPRWWIQRFPVLLEIWWISSCSWGKPKTKKPVSFWPPRSKEKGKMFFNEDNLSSPFVCEVLSETAFSYWVQSGSVSIITITVVEILSLTQPWSAEINLSDIVTKSTLLSIGHTWCAYQLWLHRIRYNVPNVRLGVRHWGFHTFKRCLSLGLPTGRGKK